MHKRFKFSRTIQIFEQNSNQKCKNCEENQFHMKNQVGTHRLLSLHKIKFEQTLNAHTAFISEVDVIQQMHFISFFEFIFHHLPRNEQFSSTSYFSFNHRCRKVLERKARYFLSRLFDFYVHRCHFFRVFS